MAEAALLGLLLVREGAELAQVRDLVAPGDLSGRGHVHVLAAMYALADAGEPVNAITVDDYLRRAGWHEQSGGGPYLATLLGDAPAGDALHYAHMVSRAAALRLAGIGGQQVTDAAEREDANPSDLAEKLRQVAQEVEARVKPGAASTLAGRVLTREALRDLPEPQWLIRDTLPADSLAVLAGWTGTGKSFLALDWASCVATGKPWQGRAVGQGPVLYVAAEGVAGMPGRFDAWEYAWQHKVTGLHVLTQPVNLLDPGAVRDLLALVRRTPYALVVLDTLARCLVGGDENSAKDMGVAVDAADRVRRVAGSAVLLVHHTGKDRDTVRGSSALESGVDTVYQTKGDPRCVHLSRTKAKDVAVEDEHRLSLLPVLSSAVVQSVGPSDIGPDDPRSTRQVLDIVRTMAGVEGLTRPQIVELADEQGLSRSTVYKRVNALFTTGALTNVGTETRPRYVPSGVVVPIN